MIAAETGNDEIRKKFAPSLLVALAVAIGFGVIATGCGAAELLGTARRANLPALLASVTGLSDAAMANEKGTGLRSPVILDDATGRARVLLWDELRISPQLAPATDSTMNTGK
jgi:hypothetical protein